jgi:hypothetical protein
MDFLKIERSPEIIWRCMSQIDIPGTRRSSHGVTARRWGIIGQLFSRYEIFWVSVFAVARVTRMASLDSCGQTLEFTLSRQPRRCDLRRPHQRRGLPRPPPPSTSRRSPPPFSSCFIASPAVYLICRIELDKIRFFPPPGSRICSGGARSVEPR